LIKTNFAGSDQVPRVRAATTVAMGIVCKTPDGTLRTRTIPLDLGKTLVLPKYKRMDAIG
jgi:hypothetical protein